MENIKQDVFNLTHYQVLFPECNPPSIWHMYCISDQGMMHLMFILSLFSLHLQVLMITVGVMAHSMSPVESLGTLSMEHSSMLVFMQGIPSLIT